MRKTLISLSTFALALSTFAGIAGAQERRRSEPVVEVWLSGDGDFRFGDRARAWIRAEEDGYAVVLHVNTDGRIHPLFPLRPGDDQFVRRGKKVEIRGNGDRDAFVVDDTIGRGSVLVAFSRS